MCTHTCVQTQHKAVHSGAVCSGRKRPDYKRRGPEPEPPWDGMPPLSETLRVCGRRAGSTCVVMRKGKEQQCARGVCLYVEIHASPCCLDCLWVYAGETGNNAACGKGCWAEGGSRETACSNSISLLYIKPYECITCLPFKKVKSH